MKVPGLFGLRWFTFSTGFFVIPGKFLLPPLVVYNSCKKNRKERPSVFSMNIPVQLNVLRPSIVDSLVDLVKGLQKEKIQRRYVVHPQVSV